MDAEPNQAAPPPVPPPAPPPTGGSSDWPAPDPMAEFVRRLSRAGLEPGTTEVADALWLARWSVPTAPEAVQAGTPQGPAPESVKGPAGAPGDLPQVPGDGTDGAGSRLVPPEQDDEGRVALYPGTAEPGQGHPGRTGFIVAIPEATALPGLLELQAALRPLQRYRSPARPRRSILDEAATAERTARAGGLLLPVFRAVNRGDATMQLLMDASSSMYVWERMLRELGGVFECLGAFREVQVRHLHATADGVPAVSSHFDPDPSALRSADQLGDPTGRRITLLVSDCAGPLWSSGQAHRLLHRLAGHGPVAVLQPLPARLWSRTRLPVSYGVLHRADGPQPAAPLRFSAGAGGFTTPPAGDALPVPVLPPTTLALGAWARLLAGTGPGEVPAAVGWVRSDQPASVSRPRRETMSPAALVARFRSAASPAAASPAAAQLAVYLSAAPLFLPVMQLVQRTMLPGSGPAELAEVLLSGLVVRAEGDDHRWYEFAPGVRDILLQPLGLDEALLVLKHCSEYVEHRFGRGGPNFPALAITQLAGGPSDPAADAAVASAVRHAAWEERTAGVGVHSQQPFAEVAARVLERFVPFAGSAGAARAGGRTASGSGGGTSSVVLRARELVARFRDEGMVQNLLEAVQMLRRAAAEEFRHSTDPELWSELAEQLVRLWRLRGGPGLLREAQDAAETAAAHLGSVKARSARAAVLRASADDRAAAGDNRAALELLRRADRELTAVCAAPELGAGEVLDATLERVQVLEDQWALSGETALLEETVGMLEAFADAWPPNADRPSQLALAHGRALLRLAGAAVDRERKQVYAQQAAESFRAGLDALQRADAPAEQLVAAILSLVDALLAAGGRLPAAQQFVDRALGETRDRLLRAAILARAGRIRVARHAEGGPAGELEAAAGRFAEACRLTPRDRPEYSNLVAEWGAALLDRAALPGGELFVNRAVLVLRDCRMETPADDPRLPARLMMLGRALVLRYAAEGDLVDLREAEHVLTRAVQPAEQPAQVARINFELGEVHRLAYRHTRRSERLDHAAEAFRRAAQAAGTAAAGSPDREPLVRLAALAHHRRGEVYELAHRPRAAANAYRAALAEWRQLPDEGGDTGRRTVENLAAINEHGGP
ncbi:SAV_2336 N-terminal domain-related protein [Streptomyces sp. NPDC049040]|uniref:SAV_2336 N-terminal domain-related protein n=1 Tax=Streptomyces sp. NPDC049040 TaxID=3365593 RepID=UPI00372075E2